MNLEGLLDIDKISLDHEAIHPTTKEKVKDVFCDHWEQTRKGLELMLASINNPIVKLIIYAIISVGNNLNVKFCPK